MKQWKDIDGWFDFLDVYDLLISLTPDSGNFIECGGWFGRSSAYLCDIALSKNINVYIVDSWLGSKSEISTYHKLASEIDIYSIFKQNMGNRKYTPIKKLSQEAAQDFENNSCDVVFIDMDHEYESVYSDIICWIDKVKPKGYLAGHDYNEKDWPGVFNAVNDLLGPDNIKILSRCWIYQKPDS